MKVRRNLSIVLEFLRNDGCLVVFDDCYRICSYFLLYFRIGGNARHPLSYSNQFEKMNGIVCDLLFKNGRNIKLHKKSIMFQKVKHHYAISLFPITLIHLTSTEKN